jgi:hypothetical protein
MNSSEDASERKILYKKTLSKTFVLGVALVLSMTATGLAQSTSGSIRAQYWTPPAHVSPVLRSPS